MYNFSCTIFYLFISFFLDVADRPITQRRIFQTTHAKCISGWSTHFLKISAILLGFISTAKFRKCHQLRIFFCNLSRKFVAPLRGKFLEDLLGVTDPEMFRYVFVAVNVAISDIWFFVVGLKLLKQTCSMKAPWQEVGSYTTHLMSLIFVCQTNNFTYTFKSSLYFHSVGMEKGNMPMEKPSSFWWGGWVRKTPAFSLSLGWYM